MEALDNIPVDTCRLRRKHINMIVRELQSRFPTIYPVKVQVTSKLKREDGVFGDTTEVVINKRVYLGIRLASWLTYPADFLVLHHEYAHCMEWRPPHQIRPDDEHHPPDWGIAEARLWTYIGDYTQEAE